MLTSWGDRSIIMRMRTVLVIAMLLQSLALAGPAHPAAAPMARGGCSSSATCCCTGESGPDRCAPVGRAIVCMCGDASESRPAAPAPRQGKDRTPLLALPVTLLGTKLPNPVRYSLQPKPGRDSGASHNEIQALLCVWRT